MMDKQRFRGLDGLRGLAALSVAISHAGFTLAGIVNFAPLLWLMSTLAVGPNSVQIFFVLSGFLIAALYPQVKSYGNYLFKRYARIFPPLIIATLLLGLNHLGYISTWPWYRQAALLILMAGWTYYASRYWQLLDKSGRGAKILFGVFLFLQLGLVLFNLLVVPQFTQMHQLTLPEVMQDWLLIFSNFTLTTPFARDLVRFASIYWSLPPEVIFYILYPLLFLPLIAFARRQNTASKIIIWLLILKILFDLDDVLRGTLGLSTFNISRANGFLVGATVGTIFQSGGLAWQKLAKLGQMAWFNLLVLMLFILVQAGDWAVRDGQSIWFMNNYYLLSSLVVGALLVTLLNQRSLNARLFSNRLLVFLGLISYSLYLLHSRTIDWAHQITSYFAPVITNQSLLRLVDFGWVLAASIGASYLVYYLVERLYFISKASVPSSAKPVNQPMIKASGNSLLLTLMRLTLAVGLLFWLYTAQFSPTLLVSHHTVGTNSRLKLRHNLLNGPVRFPITATHNQLGVLTFNLWYYQNAEYTARVVKEPATLYFRLYRSGESKPFFVSNRSAYDIEGEPNFPFGFPAISNSAGKTYQVELELKQAKPRDTILVNTWPGRVSATYLSSLSAIIHAPQIWLFNRLGYFLTHPDILVDLMGVLIVWLLCKLGKKADQGVEAQTTAVKRS